MIIQEMELITAPSVEPVTLEEAKAHLRVSNSYEDDLISALIVSAREFVEGYTGRALITQTRKVYMDRFYPVISLPYPKLQTVSSIKYIDENGTEQTVDSSIYREFSSDYTSQIILKDSEDYPDTESEPKVVNIEYICGYGDAADSVPQGIKQAMLLQIGGWFRHRESIYYAAIGTVAGLPEPLDVVRSLLDKYKVARV